MFNYIKDSSKFQSTRTRIRMFVRCIISPPQVLILNEYFMSMSISIYQDVCTLYNILLNEYYVKIYYIHSSDSSYLAPDCCDRGLSRLPWCARCLPSWLQPGIVACFSRILVSFSCNILSGDQVTIPLGAHLVQLVAL